MSDLKTILKTWENNKQILFKLLGNNLILKRPYTYASSVDNLAKEIDNKRNCSAYRDFKDWINRNVIVPLSRQYEYYDLYELLLDIMSSETLADNKYSGDTKIYLFPDGELFKVSKGMRPMKIITKVAQKYKCKPEVLEQFRIWHSLALNQKHVDGELCLSIHPLDYITMSDNDNNWESCMNWINKGDYRSGTIECLNSPYILIAYLHNPNHTMSPLPDWEWNSKRWRELFIIREEIITEIKGYCFQDENLTNTVLMWIKELAHNNLNWDYDNDEINMKETINWNENDDMCFRFYTNLYMYNDFGTLDNHSGRINRQKLGKYQRITEWKTTDNKWHFMAEFPYGGEATCMWCGEPIENTGREDAVMCISCDGGIYCSCCGNYIPSNNIYYITDCDDPFCENCFDYECDDDSITGNRYLTGDLTLIKLLIDYDFDEIKPIFYHNYIYVFEPEFNTEYKKIFSVPPRVYKHGYCNEYYVQPNDIIDINVAKEIFMLDDDINLEQLRTI